MKKPFLMKIKTNTKPLKTMIIALRYGTHRQPVTSVQEMETSISAICIHLGVYSGAISAFNPTVPMFPFSLHHQVLMNEPFSCS